MESRGNQIQAAGQLKGGQPLFVCGGAGGGGKSVPEDVAFQRRGQRFPSVLVRAVDIEIEVSELLRGGQLTVSSGSATR